MIYRIQSTLPKFKSLDLNPGLNILLADVTRGSTEKQTRNGAGKTSLIEVVHFLFGADCKSDSIFRKPELIGYSFVAEFDLARGRTKIERSGGEPRNVLVREANTRSWPRKPERRDKDQLSISNENWKSVLGKLIFGLNPEKSSAFGPKFRSLFSYFVRRQLDGGFARPQQQSSMQQPADQQVAITFLLGLDWSIPQRQEALRRKEQTLKTLRRAARDEMITPILGNSANLRTALTIAEAHVKTLSDQLTSFHVLPEYEALEGEATQLTIRLSDLANQNLLDEHLIASLEQSLEQETAPTYAAIEAVYKEAGVLLPGLTAKRFDEVRLFHDSVVRNRRSYLEGELSAARDRKLLRGRESTGLDQRRAQIMEILKSGGALNQFTRLQEELGRVKAEAELLRRQRNLAEQIESMATQLDIDRVRLFKNLQDDYKEQNVQLDEAILAFQELSGELYEKGGFLTVTPTPRGPEFKFSIDAARSKGINNMQIFCFDMTLMQLCASRGIGPRFLIHDSHLFDGVDSRQVARALQLGARRAKESGFQYLVTLNSDALPRDKFSPDFKVDDYILRQRLTDSTNDGGLFGLRFN
jgi:uncharacterized protein YydD (DUF2326 family)